MAPVCEAMAGCFDYNAITLFKSYCTSFQPKPTPKYAGTNANPKAVSLTASRLVSLILIHFLCFYNSADYTTSSALFLVIYNVKGGYWYNHYIKAIRPKVVLLIDIYLEI